MSGFGNDTIIGGGGMDTFVFDSILNASANMDTIADFSVVDDTIRLDRTIFAKLTTLGTLNTAFFNSSTTGKALDSNDYILYNTTTGALLYDADANGTGLATQFATLTTKPAITARILSWWREQSPPMRLKPMGSIRSSSLSDSCKFNTGYPLETTRNKKTSSEHSPQKEQHRSDQPPP